MQGEAAREDCELEGEHYSEGGPASCPGLRYEVSLLPVHDL